MSDRRFPLFVDLTGRRAVVVGGGPVGLRRAKALAEFGAEVTLISPRCGEAPPPQVRYLARPYAAGDLAGAERLLYDVPQKDGEWYFLSGSIAYRKGWMDEAMQNYVRAVQLDPNNIEYRRALAVMQQGNMGGYRPAGYSSGADAMDCCTTMMCLNCLCSGCN